MSDDIERRLAEIATSYVGMFLLELSHEETAAAAHGLFLLAEEAQRRRERLLARDAR